MEMTFNPTAQIGKRLFYEYQEGDGEVIIPCYENGHACHSNIFHSRYDFPDKDFKEGERKLVSFVEKNQIPYPQGGFQWWMSFMNECGFKNTLEEVDGKFVYTLYPKDYTCRYHFVGALTAIRYIHYNYSTGYTKIPEKCFKIRELFPEWDAMEVLLIGNLLIFHDNSYMDTNHSLSEYRTSRIFTRAEILERCQKYVGVNKIFSQRTDRSVGEHAKIDKESLQTLYNLLKNANH